MRIAGDYLAAKDALVAGGLGYTGSKSLYHELNSATED
jgi:hypothetical protein